PSPSGSALLGISTALVTFHVEPPHLKATALYKYPTNRYKNKLKRSTGPNNCASRLNERTWFHEDLVN
ncbi:hypothetical protein, partial [Vibrio breoganii]|uniref:hypothetical protein n=1 Tax=Vibrio breoganii TaxID=553239 RepID=UPI0019827146